MMTIGRRKRREGGNQEEMHIAFASNSRYPAPTPCTQKSEGEDQLQVAKAGSHAHIK